MTIGWPAPRLLDAPLVLLLGLALPGEDRDAAGGDRGGRMVLAGGSSSIKACWSNPPQRRSSPSSQRAVRRRAAVAPSRVLSEGGVMEHLLEFLSDAAW